MREALRCLTEEVNLGNRPGGDFLIKQVYDKSGYLRFDKKMENKNKKSSLKFKKIANYFSRPEAEMVASLLKKQNIPVLIQSEAAGIFGSSAVSPPEGISLLVLEKDIERALNILPYKE